jgi:hypothetical protein
MTATATSPPRSARLGWLSGVMTAGLAGGAVDLVYATVVGATLGRSFQKVWQGVASGWLGKASGQMGWGSAALGLLTHFGIATSMAAAYALAAGRLPVLYRRPVLAGAAYGLVLYGVMYGVVLPLRFPQAFPRWDGVRSLTDIAAHMGVGLAIALVLSRGRARA